MKLNKPLFLISFLTLLVSCSSTDQKKEPTDSLATESFDCYSHFNKLYEELLIFKDDKDFHSYGFGQGGKFYEWLKKVENIKEKSCEKLLSEHSFAFSELKSLGLEYVKTKGKENDYTAFLNNQFKPKEIVSEPEKEVETKDNLIGKWKLINSYAPNESVEMHILLKDGFYYQYMPESGKEKKLSKKGNKYFIVGDKYGEYYKISADNNLEMYDKDGSLDEVGWSAKKL